MSRQQRYEVILQETRTFKIHVDAIDTDEAEERATDIYLHEGFNSLAMFEMLDAGGGHEIISVAQLKTNESTTDALR